LTARRAQPLPRSVVVVGVALPLLLLVAVVVSNVVGGDVPEPTAPYAADVRTAFADVNPVLLDVVETASRWATGDAADEELRGALDAARAALPGARAAIGSLEEPEGAAPARAMYLASVDMYAVAVDAFGAALAVTPDERLEIELLGRRVRTIADRLFDRGRAIVEPSSGGDVPGVSVVRSDPVPDWDADGLAPAGGAGVELDRAALDQPDDEPGRRAGLRLLVLAEVERAEALGLDDVASALDAIADALPS
jgi:hypothetical protein